MFRARPQTILRCQNRMNQHTRETMEAVRAVNPRFSAEQLMKDCKATQDDAFVRAYREVTNWLRGLRTNRSSSIVPSYEYEPNVLVDVANFDNGTECKDYCYALLVLGYYLDCRLKVQSRKEINLMIIWKSLLFTRCRRLAGLMNRAFVDIYSVILDRFSSYSDVLEVVYEFMTHAERTYNKEVMFGCLMRNFALEERSDYTENESDHVTQLLLMFVDEVKRKKISSDISEIWDSIKGAVKLNVASFSDKSMEMCAKLREILGKKQLIEMQGMFSSALINYIDAAEKPFQMPSSKLEVVEVFDHTKESDMPKQYDFSEDDGDVDREIDSVTSDVCSIYSDGLIERIKKIVAVTAKDESATFIEAIVNYVEENKGTDFTVNYLAAIVYYCNESDKSRGLMVAIQALVSSEIFNEHYSIYDDQRDFESLGTLRNFVVQVACRNNRAIHHVFQKLASYPALLGEVIQRTELRIDVFSRTVGASKSLLLSIVDIMNRFNMRRGRYCKIVRRVSFRLLDALFDRADMSVMMTGLMGEVIFRPFFVASLFDYAEKPKIMWYLTTFHNNMIHDTIKFAMQCAYATQSERGVSLVYDIIECVCNICDMFPELYVNFMFIIDMYVGSLIKGKGAMHIFRFLKYFPDRYLSKKIDNLLETMMKSEAHTLDDELYDELMDVLRRDGESDNKPFIVKLLLKCFWQERRDKVMEDMEVLCSRSTNDKIILHKGGLDVFLIKHLDSDVGTKCMAMFKSITMVVASPIVVYDFVSLLRADKDGSMNANICDYIRCMSDLILDSLDRPPVTLESGTKIEIEWGWKGSFCFSGWVYCEKVGTFTVLENDKIMVSIVNRQLLFKDVVGCITMSHAIEECVTRSWFLLTVVVMQSSVSVYAQEKELMKFRMLCGDYGKSVIAGGSRGAGRIGSFAVYRELSSKQIERLCKNGPRMELTGADFGHFSCKGLSIYRAEKTKDSEISTFADVLLNVCKIEIIFPLFAQLGGRDRDTGEHSRITNALVTLLWNALISREQQRYFASIDGFNLIAHLMVSTESWLISYELYLSFFEMLLRICSDRKFKQCVIDVLFNFELWRHTPEFVDVSRHWCDELFPQFAKALKMRFRVKDIFRMMRVYLCYEKTEDIAKEHKNLGIAEIQEVRKNLNNIIVTHYKTEIITKDMVVLLGHVATLQDYRQVVDILRLWRELPECIGSIFAYGEAFPILNRLVISNSDDVVAETLQLVIYIHERKLLNHISLSDHLCVLFQVMKFGVFSDSRLEKLAALLDESPRLFEIVSYVAAMTGSSATERFFRGIEDKPRKEYCATKMWLVWSIWAAVKFDNAAIFGFLCRCSTGLAMVVFTAIEYMCNMLNVLPNVGRYQGELVDTLIKQLENGDKMDDSHMEIFMIYLFYKRRGLSAVRPRSLSTRRVPTNTWENVIRTSIWYKALNDDNVPTPRDPENEMFYANMEPKENYFGLEMEIAVDSVGEWIDKDRAEKIMCLCHEMKSQAEIRLGMTAAVFLSRCKDVSVHASAVKFVNDMKKAKKSTLEFERLACYIDARSANGPYRILEMPVLFELTRASRCMDWSRVVEKLVVDADGLIEQRGHWFRAGSAEASVIISKEDEKMIRKSEDLERKLLDISRKWQWKWSHMTSDHAPWSFQEKRRHYMRDTRGFYGLCPASTKVNRGFDQAGFNRASKTRDTGDFIPEVQKPVALHPLEIDGDLPKERDADGKGVLYFAYNLLCRVVKVKKTKGDVMFSLNNEFLKIGIKLYRLSDVTHVLLRRFKFHPTGIEIFFKTQKPVLLDFISRRNDLIAAAIGRRRAVSGAFIQTGTCAEVVQDMGVTEKWKQRKMSNFDYLMHLNVIAGRTFNDPSQYPILPWIIADYDSQTVNFEDKSFFRDLSKPIGALGEERLRELLERLGDMKLFDVPPFLYSSYCSSPLAIFWFLIRLEPFTSQHILMQSGRFDNSYRIFRSLKMAYQSVISQMNDYRELVPEMFFQPEALMNLDGFDFGKVSNCAIGDVELPPWAKSAAEFVYLNRKAMESAYVSENINHWIDLIFGYKQRGEEARRFNNMFKEEMYDDIWDRDPTSNKMRKGEIETTLEQVGQVPPQLFVKPHVARDSLARAEPRYGIAWRIIDGHCDYVFGNVIATKDDYVIHVINSTYSYETAFGRFGETVHIWFDRRKDKLRGDLSDYTVVSDTKVLALCNQKLEAVIIDAANGYACKKVTSRRQRITAVSADDGVFTLSTDDGRVHVYVDLDTNKPGEPTFSIPTYRNYITCSCVSRRFGIVVSGTNDNVLVIGSITNGSTIRVVDLAAFPEKVLITPAWGFIIVSLCDYVAGKEERSLCLYTLNGIHVRTVPIEERFTHWTAWANASGFDFVAASSDSGFLYAFEAFFLDARRDFVQYHCKPSVVGLTYSMEAERLFVVTSSGLSHIIPMSKDLRYDDSAHVQKDA